jgi:hypothetical protein
MDREVARQLASELASEAVVVDVGGGSRPFPRANYIIDAIPYAVPPTEVDPVIGAARYTEQTWAQVDICRREPWPFPDKFFDFAVCTQTLEDIRDPVWVCSELNRIAKAGYVETPSRILEQTMGIENPYFAGYYHHRWLVSAGDKGIEFRHKPHFLHAWPNTIVSKLGLNQALNPKYENFQFRWKDRLEATEVLEFSEDKLIEDLASFARTARGLPDLLVPAHGTLQSRIKRAIYFARVRRSSPK